MGDQHPCLGSVSSLTPLSQHPSGSLAHGTVAPSTDIVKEPESGHPSTVASLAVKGTAVVQQHCCYSYEIIPTAVLVGGRPHLPARKCTASGNMGVCLQSQQV